MNAARDLGLLVGLRLRLLVRSASSRYTRGAKRVAPLRIIALIVIVVWGLGTLAGPAAFLLTSFLSTAAGRVAFGSVLALASSAATFVMIFYAFITLVGMMTYRSDLGLLLLAPISARLVMAEKLGSVSLGFSPILLLMVPALLGAGHVLHLGIPYDVTVVAFVLLLPLAPVSLAMLLLLPLLRFLPPVRARTVATVLGMLVGAGLFIGSQLLAGPGRRTTASVSFPLLPAFLPSTWPGRMVAAVAAGQQGPALFYLAATVVLAAMLFSLAVVVSARVLATGSATYHEVGRQKRVRHAEPRTLNRTLPLRAPGRARSRGSSWGALVGKEWLVLRRDPTRLMQLGYPLILVGFYWYQGLTSPTFASLRGSPGARDEILPIVILLALSTWLFINALAPSIVNREGRSLYLLAQAPLSPRDILLAKWAVCVVPVLLLLEVMLAGSAVTRHLPAIDTLLIAVTLVILVTALTGIVLCCALIWPRLITENPRRHASGIAILVSAIAELIIAGIVFTLLVVAITFWNSIPIVAAMALAAIAVILGLVLLTVFFAGPRLMQRILYRASGL